MKSTKKTNAARILDRMGISYELKEYPVDVNDLSAVNVAAKVGMPVQQGTPIHLLSVKVGAAGGDAAPTVGFNGQENEAEGIAHVEFGEGFVRVTPAGGLLAGRVSLAPELEVFEDAKPTDAEFDALGVDRFEDLHIDHIRVDLPEEGARWPKLEAHLACFADPEIPPMEYAVEFDEDEDEGPSASIHLDADVLEGFCYGQPWYRKLTLQARTQLLEALREQYQRALRAPPGIALHWHLAPDSRMAGPCVVVLSGDERAVQAAVGQALREAAEEMRFGDDAEAVLAALRDAATRA